MKKECYISLLLCVAVNTLAFGQLVVNSGTDFYIDPAEGVDSYEPSIGGHFQGEGKLRLRAAANLLSDTDIDGELVIKEDIVLTVDGTPSLDIGGLHTFPGAEFVNIGPQITSTPGMRVRVRYNIPDANHWHYISPSVQLPKTEISGTSNFINLYRYDEASAYWIWWNSNSPSGPAQGASVIQPAFGNDLIPGTAYAVMFNSSKEIILENENGATSHLVDGPVSVPVTVSDLSTELQSPLHETYSGMNLIGNPYPSSIDLADFLSNNSNIESVYLWNGNSGIEGDYTPYNSLNASGVNLAIGQGMLAKISSAGTVNFTNSMRTSAGILSRTSPEFPKLELALNYGDKHSATSFYFLPDGKHAFEKGRDAVKVNSPHGLIQQISSYVGHTPCAIQVLPEKEEANIPLSIQVAEDGYYKLNGTSVLMTTDNWELFDKQTGETASVEKGFASLYLKKEEDNNRRFFLRTVNTAPLTNTSWEIWNDQQSIYFHAPGATSYQLTDIQGKILESGLLHGASQLKLKHSTPSGLYFFQLSGSATAQTQKILIH